VVYERFHGRFRAVPEAGLNYDLFTSTHTDNHFRISQDIFLALKAHGCLPL
jgi:methionyl-tRNA synthetase